MDPLTLLLPLLLIACGVAVLRRRKKRRLQSGNDDILPAITPPVTLNGDALDGHRDAILGFLWTVIAGLEKKRQGDPANADGWSVLTGAVLKYATALKLRPRDIPVIIISATNAAAILERESETGLPDAAAASDIREMSFYLDSAAAAHKNELLKMHGPALSTADTKQALDFINSLQWDRSQKAFVSKTLH